jgi:predicted AlkP superfamily pyrophosphatase or phosphodiesterase
VYVPHLDYAAQKFGPNSPEAQRSLAELDQQLAVFAAQIAAAPGGEQAVYLVAGEYALTDVTGVVYPNRILREAGLVNVCVQDGAEYLNLPACAAFAMVDHQFAHVYVRDADDAAVRRVVELFRSFPGVAEVAAGADRERLGMDHERSGEIILVAEDTHWFAYYWWLEDRLAPPFARTVDIHRKPGYDPVELFFDPATKGIPLNAALVKGSHGVPATRPEHRTALLCSTTTDRIRAGRVYRDTDVFSVIVG